MRHQELRVLIGCLLGIAIGAEGDLISYMVRVYFGLASLGWSYDVYESFYQPLITFSALMLLTAIACLFLGNPARQHFD